MPEKFSLKQKTTVNSCDAKRCKADGPFHILINGSKVCDRHLAMLTEDEKEALGRDNAVDSEPTDGPSEENVRAQIEPYKNDALEIIDSLEAIEIIDEESNEMVGELLKQTHNNLKAIEAKRKEATAPLMQAKKAIDAWFKPAKTGLRSETSSGARLRRRRDRSRDARGGALVRDRDSKSLDSRGRKR
jgi:hypothetical protein